MELEERFEPVRLGGRELAVRIVRSRNRNGYATVNGSNIIISIPSRLRAGESMDMASDLYRKMRIHMLKHPLRFEENEPSFYDGKVTSPMGLDIVIRKEVSNRRNPSYRLERGTLVVRIPEWIDADKQGVVLNSMVIKALSTSMYGFVAGRVNQINKLSFNAKIGGIKIRLLKNMWGSLSPDNLITLNLKLLYAPPDVLDYVIVHELSHTVRRNHSKRFWSVVGKAMPDYKEKRAWLRELGPTITM